MSFTGNRFKTCRYFIPFSIRLYIDRYRMVNISIYMHKQTGGSNKTTFFIQVVGSNKIAGSCNIVADGYSRIIIAVNPPGIISSLFPFDGLSILIFYPEAGNIIRIIQ